MVCLGNICRSPMAAGLLRDKIKKNNLDWEVASSGTGSYHIGEAPDRRAQEMMFIMEKNISDMRAQQFKQEDFDEYDLIFCMDKENYNNVIRKADTEQKKRVSLLLDILPDSEYEEVPDPYFNNQFRLAYKLLDEATDVILEKWGGIK